LRWLGRGGVTDPAGRSAVARGSHLRCLLFRGIHKVGAHFVDADRAAADLVRILPLRIPRDGLGGGARDGETLWQGDQAESEHRP
jgi:hypothetical protein